MPIIALDDATPEALNEFSATCPPTPSAEVHLAGARLDPMREADMSA